MRRIKRLLSIFLVLCLSISIIGCSKNENASMKPEAMIKEVQSKLGNAKNFDATMNLDLELASGADKLEMNTKTDMIAFTDPYKAKIDMYMDMGALGSQNIKSYLVKENEKYLMYTNFNGEWQNEELDKKEFDIERNNYLNQLSLDMYLSNAKSFKKVSEEKIAGKQTYKLEGILTGKSLEKVISESGILQKIISSKVDKSMLSTFNDLPVIIWIESDTLMPVKISINMAQVMQGFIDSIMSTALESSDNNEAVKKVSISKCMMTIQYNNIGSAKDFDLPQDIKNLK